MQKVVSLLNNLTRNEMTVIQEITKLVHDRATENAEAAMNIYSDLEKLQTLLAENGCSHLIMSEPMIKAICGAKNIELRNQQLADDTK